ncbi:GspE/PulE family protein [Patescibacteria group bacterium]|nr:GspE/PulE family protein [Patescibacteria group bacterium]MBU1663559.1 GspE/PulE family protein [Patescibacteria group bacterium]MBU1934203.1 GspE/PulE family protein [Patescibacteria group bacterium]MBU2007583.1 GspE/PulE family protein [Patescibacteria group bacterium]MBU2233795.1 GspE/PulE family protein [Patescibacteria group bacterium]
MSNNQSIKDLFSDASGQSLNDQSPAAKFIVEEKKMKIKELERLTKQAAQASGLPYIDLVGFSISPEALILIDETEAKALETLCFFYNGANIHLASLEPQDEKVLALAKNLSKKYFSEISIYLITENSFKYGLEMYKTIPMAREVVRGVKITEEELNKYGEKFSSFKDLQAEINQAQITEIVTMIMAAAIKSDSSDIHIEAEEKLIKIRFRIDGVLHDVATINKSSWEKIISRMKLLAAVKINVINKPQDGRLSIYLKDDRVDIRASFLPTNFGESVVMRLLRSSSVGLEFKDLGIRDRAFNQLKREIERPNGMIITTGPTGSGKTTTLYAILKKLNNPETKIITIEDPIEYQLSGVNQSQVSKNYTFVQGLRSIVRQDPDVVMVGEIRDLETAEIAIQAALTGHLVLSTIHTNDAAGTVPRFMSMGAKSYLLAPALNAMIGQRLVRKICQKCKYEIKPEDEVLKRVKDLLNEFLEEDKKKIDFNNLKFYQGRGCEACQGIGYKGRIGIYEILTMNQEIQKLILSSIASEYDIRDNAKKNGMITMVQDGILKALDGITSVEEIFRVSE